MKFAQTALFRGIIMSTFMLQAQTIGIQTIENIRGFFCNISNFNRQVLSSNPFLVTP